MIVRNMATSAKDKMLNRLMSLLIKVELSILNFIKVLNDE